MTHLAPSASTGRRLAAHADAAETTFDASDAHEFFDGGRGYFNACSMGIPTRDVARAMTDDAADWLRGDASPSGYTAVVESARARFAQRVGCPVQRVAIGAQTSVFASLFAAAVPSGSEVLCVDGDFSSMVFPFLVAGAEIGYTVRHVPLHALAAEIGPRTAVVSFSLVQSIDGAMADVDAVRTAAARHDALTLCDLTQAAGAVPVDATHYDATITNAYKWLMAPRGVAFLTLSPRAAGFVKPLHAGWYAGEDVLASFYGPTMTLARTARRFDVSPAFPAWVGADAALAFLDRFGSDDVWEHNISLADAFCVGVGIEPRGRAIVSLDDPDGERFRAMSRADLRATQPDGRLRVSFHLWNTLDDVAAAVRAVRSSERRP
ncbi:putative selenocysteine lyase [Microbacterium sp. C448]|uniref:aminotransferase class V-fold PLP-dependent enzyme n=1 Tax=Microbacterium sp. C448 TaxID=1177594 RepID=UPI0003DE42B9|nr:aminotransferase class V-fold PLP-dependent enzyme [Microbacterium sp. C448]CDK01794.1 putative selenocysteine lyase [Microbacterium sp. C448]